MLNYRACISSNTSYQLYDNILYFSDLHLIATMETYLLSLSGLKLQFTTSKRSRNINSIIKNNTISMKGGQFQWEYEL